MEKQKLYLEYSLNATSKEFIWKAISTPSGLSRWFAEKVEKQEDIFTFVWGENTEIRKAKVIGKRANANIRFRWLDETEKAFFEFKLNKNELTGEFMLVIIDFATPEEIDDLHELWTSQIETLKRSYGM
jgi:hypothetical protein